MHALGHLIEELEHHAVHVGRRKHGHTLHAGFQHRAGIVLREVNVGIQGPVRDHDALGETGGAGRVVDHGQFLGGILVIIEVLGAEILRILLAERLVEVLADEGALLGVGIQELEGIDLDDRRQAGHLLLGEAFPDDLVHEQDAGLGMVHEIVDIAGLEFVQDGNGDGPVGEGGEETHAPVGLVPGTDGDLVAPVEAALLEGDVQLGDPAGDVPVGQRHTLVVGQGGTVPVGPEAFLEDLVDGFEFHYYRYRF